MALSGLSSYTTIADEDRGMTEEKVFKLMEKVQHVKSIYSKPRAKNNGLPDEWQPSSTYILSESTAFIVYDKTISGKKCGVFFYWIAKNNGQWEYFIPTYEHLFGMTHKRISQTMESIEQHNAEIALAISKHPDVEVATIIDQIKEVRSDRWLVNVRS